MSLDNYASVSYVRQCLRYENGKLFWLVRPRKHFRSDRSWRMWNTSHANKEAGNPSLVGKKKSFRHIIVINYHSYYRNVLVWAIHTGKWHIGLDHIDRDTLNDRIENLRIATQSQNNANQTLSSRNKSGYKGVSWDKKANKWVAHIVFRGEQSYLGCFDDPSEAGEAYIEAARECFEEFAYDGKSKI